jgi:hypothetical protein
MTQLQALDNHQQKKEKNFSDLHTSSSVVDTDIRLFKLIRIDSFDDQKFKKKITAEIFIYIFI